jgi:hypothetical protein
MALGSMTNLRWRCLAAVLGLGLAMAAAAAPGKKSTSPPQEALDVLLKRYQQERPSLGNSRYVALLNYRQPSWEPRFYILDTTTSELVASYLVAHGRNSDPDHDGYADRFGDREGSKQSSIGFFRTGESYVSDQRHHGLSLRLEGLSESNRSAMDRNIVVHGNVYMEPKFLKTHGKPGRSHGCMVFAPEDRDDVVEKLKGGALVYAVY